MRFNEDFWKNAFMLLLWAFLAVITCVVGYSGFSDKRVIQCELGSAGGNLEIRANTDNAPDDFIQLNGVTFEQAIAYTKELNESLIKK